MKTTTVKREGQNGGMSDELMRPTKEDPLCLLRTIYATECPARLLQPARRRGSNVRMLAFQNQQLTSQKWQGHGPSLWM